VSSPERPSLGVLVAGGVGVLAVLAFVIGVALNDLTVPSVGRRVELTRGPAGVVVLVGRCLQQRVTSIVVANADGATLWRYSLPNGSIDRHFAVAAAMPPEGPVTATVTFDHGAPARERADLGSLPFDPGPPIGTPPPCAGHRGLQPATFAFVLGALLVVGGYGVMVVRTLRT
jgi:hypothetical protein